MSVGRLFEPKTGVNRWFTILACLAYIVSPVDLIPEVVLGPFGLADDGLAFMVMIRHLLFPGRK